MKNLLIRVVFTCLSLFIAFHTIGQKADSLEFSYRPVVALKWAPLSIIDYTPTIQFALEAGTFRNQSVQAEFGWVTDLYNRTESGFDGFKLRTEYRFYFPRPIKILYNAFCGPQFMWKEVNATGKATVWRNNQTYQEIISVRLSNQTFSYYITSGCVFRFFGPFWFEVAASLGLRRLEVYIANVPEDAVLSGGVGNGGIFNPVRGEGTYHLIGFNINFRFIYLIK